MENWKKTFAVIWSGQLASILSSSVVAFAIIFWVSLETGSAQVLALAAIAGMLPQSLLGPLVGVYVDRWDRKWTMILADSFIALCTLLLAVLFWLGVARMWHIYVLLACRSIGSAFHTPAMQASVPLLAPKQQLTRIAGINQIISSLSNIIGPAFGALLINLTGIGNILLLDVAGAFIACTTLLLVRHSQSRTQHGAKAQSLARVPRRVRRHARRSGHGLVFHAGRPRVVLHHARRCDVSADDAAALRRRGLRNEPDRDRVGRRRADRRAPSWAPEPTASTASC